MNQKSYLQKQKFFLGAACLLWDLAKLSAATNQEEKDQWTTAALAQLELSICWEFSGFDEEKAWVREVIEREYTSRKLLLTSGWKSCRETPEALIRIAEFDQEPHTLALGKELYGFLHGVVLNFTFDQSFSSCRTQRKACIEGIAVHEFGHVAGLPDVALAFDGIQCLADPDTQKNEVSLPIESLLTQDSVMNACNPHWRSSYLSSSDIDALSELAAQRHYSHH